MEEKAFVWTSNLTRKLFQLRFQNDWLFKKNKQPWSKFQKILLDNGFPKEMTINHVRKKWSYTYDKYKIAKKTKNKNWRYYKMFDKHFAKTKILDKYESWTNEWRLKLIACIVDAKEQNLDFHQMWSTVETSIRSLDLPIDCCVQDLKGLWHHIRSTFNRKHRLKVKKGAELSDWPLYDAVLAYYLKFDPDYVVKLETQSACDFFSRERKSSLNYCKKNKDINVEEKREEFIWSKDITETFIQIRLQNDWLFRERKWAWNDLLSIMIEEYGFPKTLNGRDICRKWAATFGEYQKAKATNNKSWVYYKLFEVYLGEGEGRSLNPLVGWQEEWVINLINARTDLEYMFKYTSKDKTSKWREVEKRLREAGLPLDHSLLDLPELWNYLLKTYKWKCKFANQGILTEQWPYYNLMAHYMEKRNLAGIEKKEYDNYDDDFCDDAEDDMKLLDLKHKLQVKPKHEMVDMNQCRTCAVEAGCVYIFGDNRSDGVDVSEKLRIIGGVEVSLSDNLPLQICMACLQELENAFKFRRRCQDVDKEFRCAQQNNVKLEISLDGNNVDNNDNDLNVEKTEEDEYNAHYEGDFHSDDKEDRKENLVKKKVILRKKIKKKYKKYDYWKVCEVCGKHTRNLKSHLDTHSQGKFYSCDVCDKKFKFKSGLIIHKAVHDPTPRKTCEVCGKTFHILAQYKRHFVYHANERKFECDTCGKRFNTPDILRVHKRIHTDERPFTCQDCGKTFRTAGCVSRHKRIVHKPVVKHE